MVILTVRTTRGREKTVMKSINTKMGSGDYPGIKAAFYPEELKGYVFIEADTEKQINTLTDELRHVRGVIDKPASIDDLERFLSEEEEDIELEAGDTVEVIGGPFKGEEANIKRVDDANREVTIELLEAAVPIPVTISVDMVRKQVS